LVTQLVEKTASRYDRSTLVYGRHTKRFTPVIASKLLMHPLNELINLFMGCMRAAELREFVKNRAWLTRSRRISTLSTPIQRPCSDQWC